VSAVLVIVCLAGAFIYGHAYASPGVAAVEIRCKASGLHYVGRTGQGKAVCFTVSRSRRSVHEFAVGVRHRGGPTTSSASVSYQPEVFEGQVVQGAFAITVDLGARISFRGRLLGSRRADGTLKVADPSCRSVTVRWSARRSG
jgi:hypothetical protein